MRTGTSAYRRVFGAGEVRGRPRPQFDLAPSPATDRPRHCDSRRTNLIGNLPRGRRSGRCWRAGALVVDSSRSNKRSKGTKSALTSNNAKCVPMHMWAPLPNGTTQTDQRADTPDPRGNGPGGRRPDPRTLTPPLDPSIRQELSCPALSAQRWKQILIFASRQQVATSATKGESPEAASTNGWPSGLDGKRFARVAFLRSKPASRTTLRHILDDELLRWYFMEGHHTPTQVLAVLAVALVDISPLLDRNRRPDSDDEAADPHLHANVFA